MPCQVRAGRALPADAGQCRSLPDRAADGATAIDRQVVDLGRSPAPVDVDGTPPRPTVDLGRPSETSLPAACLSRPGATIRLTTPPTASSPSRRTDTEFAAEMSNRTVHGVMHLAWVAQGGGRYRPRWPST